VGVQFTEIVVSHPDKKPTRVNVSEPLLGLSHNDVVDVPNRLILTEPSVKHARAIQPSARDLLRTQAETYSDSRNTNAKNGRSF